MRDGYLFCSTLNERKQFDFANKLSREQCRLLHHRQTASVIPHPRIQQPNKDTTEALEEEEDEATVVMATGAAAYQDCRLFLKGILLK